jgi:ATP-dependent DNA ligase
MNYQTFNYIYPPRPEYKIPPQELINYDNGKYIAQPKYNGSCAMVFTNGKDLHVFNRHKEPLTKVSKEIEFIKLAKTGNWFVYAGEYLNKGKLGEDGMKEKDKFIIWDVIVWDGKYLVGETLQSRLNLLEYIYPCNPAIIDNTGRLELYEHICCTEFKGIYKAPTYNDNFLELYNSIVKTDLYEGLVLKKHNSKLAFSFQQLNNHDWQVKCRKTTKIYNF